MVVAGPIDLPECREPENMVITPDDATLWIACAGNSVVQVDIATLAVSTLDNDTNDAHGIVLNAAGTRLYYSDNNNAFEYDIVTPAFTGTMFLGCGMCNGAVTLDGTRLLCVEEGSTLEITTPRLGIC